MQKENNNNTLFNNSITNDSLNTRLNKINLAHSVYPVPVTPSELNTVKRVTQSLNLNLNSCFRENYYRTNSNDFNYILPVEIKNIVAMKLISIELPNSWYTFSSKKDNSLFYISIYNQDLNTTVDYSIIIPDGNYTSTELTDYLNDTYFTDSTATTELKYIKFSISKYSKKVTFELVPNIVYNFTFALIFNKSIDTIMKTAGWILGFRLPTYEATDTDVTAEGIYNDDNTRYVYISIDDYQYNKNNANIICLQKSIIEKNIIAKIPYYNYLSALNQQNLLNESRKYNGPINLNKINIKLLDKYGDIIDLNYMDFGFTIEVIILYENFTFTTT